jgi:hypothetical protein
LRAQAIVIPVTPAPTIATSQVAVGSLGVDGTAGEDREGWGIVRSSLRTKKLTIFTFLYYSLLFMILPQLAAMGNSP